MRVLFIDSAEESNWNLFARSSDDATSCHQFKWKNVISRSFGHRCYYLAAIDEKGEWNGILPLVHLRSRLFGNFLVSVPFVNYGGLVSNCRSATDLLLSEADRLRRSLGAAHMELRHRTFRLDAVPTKQHKVTMILDLASDVESQWRAFNFKIRNHIRKAQKSGLRSVIGNLDLLGDFYEVFARNMRDLGTPVYGENFFRNVLESFPESTKLFGIYHEEKMIAGGLGCWFKDTLEIPWASSISDYRALCPNNLLYWQAIQFAIQNGLRRFDFGRSTPNEGTYNFKKQWGALPVQLYWQYLMDNCSSMPDLSPSNPKYDRAIRLWQNLPVSVTKVLGPMIVRNIP